ncbi:MAG: hypothetical protein RMJ36_05840 [Candidatus Calescibacterium sp.]|nr:hypothetical protein [Candidatus Calescibacterium sp.]MDW8133157.1 hypothetical protein [Candidatus Calescibacterium sp.]
MINPISIKIDLQPKLVYVENYEKSIEQINHDLRGYLGNFIHEFSFCFRYKRKKVFDNNAYLYRPFIIINTFEFDKFFEKILKFQLVFHDVLLKIHNIQLIKIRPAFRGYLFFLFADAENEFESVLKNDSKFYIFEKYRKRLIEFYEKKYQRRLRSNSLMFRIKKVKDNFIVDVWGSKKMVLLLNTLGLIDTDFQSIAFFYPVYDT